DHRFVAARIDTTFLNDEWVAEARDIVQVERLPTDPVTWAYGSTLGIERSLFQQVDGFTTGVLGGGEDVDLCWRVHDAGVDLRFVDEAVLYYRIPSTAPDLFRQGWRYGRAGVSVFARRNLRDPKSSMKGWFRGFAGALRLVLFSSGR